MLSLCGRSHAESAGHKGARKEQGESVRESVFESERSIKSVEEREEDGNRGWNGGQEGWREKGKYATRPTESEAIFASLFGPGRKQAWLLARLTAPILFTVVCPASRIDIAVFRGPFDRLDSRNSFLSHS